MEAIVLVGGLGTRLRSRVANLPKAMAPVGGRPFLTLLLDQLVDQGCTRIILSVGYMRSAIYDIYHDSYRNVPIDYAVEEEPLGTGGAIRLALSLTREQAVLVLNGDTYLSVDYRAMVGRHESAGEVLTMAITMVDDMQRYGGIVFDSEHISGFTEKGQTGEGWINAGTYVLSRTFPWPGGLPAKFSFEADVVTPRISDLRPVVFKCYGKFLDIGVPEDYDRAQIELGSVGKNAGCGS